MATSRWGRLGRVDFLAPTRAFFFWYRRQKNWARLFFLPVVAAVLQFLAGLLSVNEWPWLAKSAYAFVLVALILLQSALTYFESRITTRRAATPPADPFVVKALDDVMEHRRQAITITRGLTPISLQSIQAIADKQHGGLINLNAALARAVEAYLAEAYRDEFPGAALIVSLVTVVNSNTAPIYYPAAVYPSRRAKAIDTHLRELSVGDPKSMLGRLWSNDELQLIGSSDINELAKVGQFQKTQSLKKDIQATCGYNMNFDNDHYVWLVYSSKKNTVPDTVTNVSDTDLAVSGALLRIFEKFELQLAYELKARKFWNEVFVFATNAIAAVDGTRQQGAGPIG